MTVNELAKRTGVSAHVVRYYTRIGLLHPDRNPKNGYRRFAAADVDRVSLIRNAQSVGFALSEIAFLLDSETRGTHHCCGAMLDTLSRRIEENRRKIRELQALLHRMEATFRAWGAANGCPDGHDLLCPRIQLSASGEPLEPAWLPTSA